MVGERKPLKVLSGEYQIRNQIMVLWESRSSRKKCI